MNKLLEPFQLNESIQLKNRIVMAPMTRNMADDSLRATDSMADYYAKRANCGLIITEGTVIAKSATGYSHVPGIFNPAQVNAWQKVTTKVHDAGGLIFCQIWHVGRVSHPYFLNQQLPIGPSEAEMTGPVKRAPMPLNHGKNRALTLEEIPKLIQQYANAATMAIEAGFDGIEIHGANGYLIDQFLHFDSNNRDDAYGASIADKARFAIEVTDACVDAVGNHRVGLRLTPAAYLNEIVPDKRDPEVFQYLLSELNSRDLAYVHTGAFDDQEKHEVLGNLNMSTFMRQYYTGTLIGCGSYDLQTAKNAIEQNQFDLCAFGRPFIANPNLVDCFLSNHEVVPYDVKMLAELN